MNKEHKIIFPTGNYEVELDGITVTNHESDDLVDVTISFNLLDFPKNLVDGNRIKYKIMEGKDSDH